MVVNLEASRHSHARVVADARALKHAPRRQPEPPGNCITVGLLNNMAGAAFKATERQFVSLLDAASDGLPIHVSFYALPGLTDVEAGGEHFASHYSDIETLLGKQLDGLIVTGREPRAQSLREEPYWEDFTRVLEWARTNTLSSIWSCLAAHGAILYMDGIGRRRSSEKNFGIFDCANTGAHPLTEGLPSRFYVPHSRWNGIDEADLAQRGYMVLSRVAGNGVDTFIKEDGSLFIFFQGHLEYETDTLMREYRRDVGRYIRREVETYPLLPRSYFDPATEAALKRFEERAVQSRRVALLHDVVAEMEDISLANTWQSSAVHIYKNWLNEIAARKAATRSKLAELRSS